jgi:hypothetical protein
MRSVGVTMRTVENKATSAKRKRCDGWEARSAATLGPLDSYQASHQRR